MEGSAAAAVRRMGVEHSFECSRLEQALLAEAYQRIVPGIRRRTGKRDARIAPQPDSTQAHTGQGRVIRWWKVP